MSRLGEARAALAALDDIAAQSLEPELLELVRLRVSQLNGCVYCLDLHGSNLRALGIDPRRCDQLPAWRDAASYSERERAALDWAEELTLLPARTRGASARPVLRDLFTNEEQFGLTALLLAINAWNRLAIALNAPVADRREQGR
jgi:AhpD family alkylhydroperoxidase